MHRDIKPDNIMLDNGHIRIVDFGISKLFNHNAIIQERFPMFCRLRTLNSDSFPPLQPATYNPIVLSDPCGTHGFAPPEVWQEREYSYGVDYFAMASTLHALLTGWVSIASSARTVKRHAFGILAPLCVGRTA